LKGKKHMTERHRYYIEKALAKKTPVAQIAREIGYSRQAVYEEIKRGTFEKLDGTTWKQEKVYAYDVGQRVHEERMKNRPRKHKLSPDDAFFDMLRYWIIEKRYSPEAALYRIGERRLCIKSIYNYIRGGLIPGLTVNNLPYAKLKRKKSAVRRGKTMPKGTPIDERPQEINDRNTPGHWEMDTVYSSKDDLTCLLVLSERLTRSEIVIRIKDRTMKSVNAAIDRLERKIGTPAFREKFKSITCDNGVEFSDWEHIEKSCRTKGKRTKVYFCHPYRSGERGTNENSNRFVRRWIPKGDDIGLYTPKEIEQIQDWMNDYPRPMFGGLSAREMAAML